MEIDLTNVPSSKLNEEIDRRSAVMDRADNMRLVSERARGCDLDDVADIVEGRRTRLLRDLPEAERQEYLEGNR